MKKNTKAPAKPGDAVKAGLLVTLLIVVIFGGVLLLRNRATVPGPAASIVDTPTNPPPAAPERVQPALERLVGRWLREDGGYVIEISGVAPDGQLQAAYFNPRPIHVSRAAAVEESGGGVKVGIELDDVNYPNCLYTLVFNSAVDQLQGTYFQAAIGQTYEVVFVRLPVE